jgi:cell division protein FtsZ
LNAPSSCIEFVAISTSRQDLKRCKVEKKLQLGESVTGGWGTGGDPEMGKRIILEEKERVEKVLKGTDLLFLISGLGKGTGTGVCPIVAQLANKMGVLTLGFLVLPFYFEGEKRVNQARNGLAQLEEALSALMVIPNDFLLEEPGKGSPLEEKLVKIDMAFGEAIHAVGDLLLYPGPISLDFADIRSFFQKKGRIQISKGRGTGEGAAREAAKQAISSPLVGRIPLKEARCILLNIRGGEKLSLSGVEEATLMVREDISPRTEVIFGMSVDKDLSEEVILTLVAAGGEARAEGEARRKKEVYQRELDLKVYEGEDLDIPAFLRKGAN